MAKSPSTFPVASPLAAADSQSLAAPPVNMSPEKWAEVYFPATDKGRLHEDAWKHSAASQLHAWAAYTARTGKPVELSKAAYEAALAAVSGNELKPHSEADYRTRS